MKGFILPLKCTNSVVTQLVAGTSNEKSLHIPTHSYYTAEFISLLYCQAMFSVQSYVDIEIIFVDLIR